MIVFPCVLCVPPLVKGFLILIVAAEIKENIGQSDKDQNQLHNPFHSVHRIPLCVCVSDLHLILVRVPPVVK